MQQGGKPRQYPLAGYAVFLLVITLTFFGFNVRRVQLASHRHQSSSKAVNGSHKDETEKILDAVSANLTYALQELAEIDKMYTNAQLQMQSKKPEIHPHGEVGEGQQATTTTDEHFEDNTEETYRGHPIDPEWGQDTVENSRATSSFAHTGVQSGRGFGKDMGDSTNEPDGSDGAGVQHPKGTIPIVIFTMKRVEYLKPMLDHLLQKMPKNSNKWVVYVSQDGDQYPQMTDLLKQYKNENKIHHLTGRRTSTGMSEEDHRKFGRNSRGFLVYYAIAHHYKWAIDSIFSHSANFDRILVLEEDLLVADDFFEYFGELSNLFDTDNDLYCVSAWADNGYTDAVYDNQQLYRTDFFPGLGWMTSRKIWEELSAKWNPGFWDDWMRKAVQRKGRQCIRPEVSRTQNIGMRGGASGSQFHDKLNKVELSDVYVSWSSVDIDYTKSKSAYQAWFDKLLADATPLKTVLDVEALRSQSSKGVVKEYTLTYDNAAGLIAMCKHLGLMDDFKEGVPRTAYNGVITFRRDTARIHLVPSGEPTYDSSGSKIPEPLRR